MFSYSLLFILLLFINLIITNALLLLQNFTEKIKIKNSSFDFIIDNYTLEFKSHGYVANLYFHIVNYDIIFFGKREETNSY